MLTSGRAAPAARLDDVAARHVSIGGDLADLTQNAPPSASRLCQIAGPGGERAAPSSWESFSLGRVQATRPGRERSERGVGVHISRVTGAPGSRARTVLRSAHLATSVAAYTAAWMMSETVGRLENRLPGRQIDWLFGWP